MEGRIYYQKLVRDNIPEIIRAKGSECEVRELSDAECKRELLKKLIEESTEASKVTDRDALIHELADILEAMDALKKLEGISDKELLSAKEESGKKRGGFTKKLYLEWSSDDGYRSSK